jgi:glutathione synthase/RimK-type ligase-like ATP-grasp enzyme
MSESTSTYRIGVLTRHDDFHAHVMRHVLQERNLDCRIILTDSMAGVGGISWSTSAEVKAATVCDIDGQEVVVADLDAVWFRRLTGEPRIPGSLRDEGIRDLVINDCRAALLGMMLTEFGGTWVSHPEMSRAAQNKLVQLKMAQRARLRLPRTLVSQDPQKVRRFCENLEYRVVVKPVIGSQKTPVMAGMVTPEVLTDDAVRLSPAIYQEFVPGTRHLRVCCFGTRVRTALLETETLDWRYPLDADVAPYELDAETAGCVLQVIEHLGLRMGIIDMKLDADGRPVWLEVNPQGQFMFLEGMCSGMRLTQTFADFLVEEAQVGSNSKKASVGCRQNSPPLRTLGSSPLRRPG